MTQSNQWAAGTSIGGLNQESSSSNLVTIMQAVIAGGMQLGRASGPVMMQQVGTTNRFKLEREP